MLFVLDVGNTNTVLGVFKDNKLEQEWRIKTDRYKTEDEFGMLIKSLFEDRGVLLSSISAIVISSVVPPIMRALEKMCKIYFDIKPIIVGKEIVQPLLKMLYPHPEELGADRVVNAIGGIEEYGAPLIIIDFGTATTYCYIDPDGAYIGGLITPGIHISLDALYQKAAKLPKIEIEAPKRVIGRSTVEAMKSGVFYGYVAQVDGIINQIEAEVQVKPKVIATGGLASLISDASTVIDEVNLHLTLEGLNIIYGKLNNK